MKAYALFGSTFTNLEAIRDAVEEVLGIVFERHESSYHGGDYFRCGDMPEEHFVLQKNLDVDEPAEPDFTVYATLLYVNDTVRLEEIASLLGRAKFPLSILRQEEL